MISAVRAVAAAALVALGWAAWLAAPAPAQAADTRPGSCTTADADAVTLVIDYQDLGGATEVYCVTGLARSAVGMDVLTAAGVATQGTVHDGPGFLCRIQSRPGPQETIALTDNPTYTEVCDRTPPVGAHWTYWTAAKGETTWTYSSRGVTTNRVALGGYEGWSFALNDPGSTGPPPRTTPVTAPPAGPGQASSSPGSAGGSHVDDADPPAWSSSPAAGPAGGAGSGGSGGSGGGTGSGSRSGGSAGGDSGGSAGSGAGAGSEGSGSRSSGAGGPDASAGAGLAGDGPDQRADDGTSRGRASSSPASTSGRGRSGAQGGAAPGGEQPDSALSSGPASTTASPVPDAASGASGSPVPLPGDAARQRRFGAASPDPARNPGDESRAPSSPAVHPPSAASLDPSIDAGGAASGATGPGAGTLGGITAVLTMGAAGGAAVWARHRRGAGGNVGGTGDER